MKSHTLSFEFQLFMLMLGAFFWLLGLIPFVNVITNAIYWLIWAIVFFNKYRPLIAKIALAGVDIGTIYVKIGLISFFFFVLGEIPIISLIPWDIISNLWINSLINELARKIEEVTKDTKKLANAWQERQQGSRNMRRESSADTSGG